MEQEKLFMEFIPGEKTFPIKVGDIIYVMEDIYYAYIEDMDYLTEEELSVFEKRGDELVIPSGTKMKFVSEADVCGWPLFEIIGNNGIIVKDIAFAGDPFLIHKEY